MKRDDKRFDLAATALDQEAAADAPPTRWHRVIQQVGQSEEEAIDAYGRDRIGPNDRILIHELVLPQFDANGSIIPRVD